jgi:hypothetical protein
MLIFNVNVEFKFLLRIFLLKKFAQLKIVSNFALAIEKQQLHTSKMVR